MSLQILLSERCSCFKRGNGKDAKGVIKKPYTKFIVFILLNCRCLLYFGCCFCFYCCCSLYFRFDKILAKISIFTVTNTVNMEIFARILFLRIALKEIFAMLKIRDFGMIYLHQ